MIESKHEYRAPGLDLLSYQMRDTEASWNSFVVSLCSVLRCLNWWIKMVPPNFLLNHPDRVLAAVTAVHGFSADLVV